MNAANSALDGLCVLSGAWGSNSWGNVSASLKPHGNKIYRRTDMTESRRLNEKLFIIPSSLSYFFITSQRDASVYKHQQHGRKNTRSDAYRHVYTMLRYRDCS